MNPQTKQIMSLLLSKYCEINMYLFIYFLLILFLDPFDYYVFQFAYHLINPWQQRAGSAVTSWNTVYYVLCCDYIIHFLPTDPTAIVSPIIYYNGKNPLQAMKSSLQYIINNC